MPKKLKKFLFFAIRLVISAIAFSSVNSLFSSLMHREEGFGGEIFASILIAIGVFLISGEVLKDES